MQHRFHSSPRRSLVAGALWMQAAFAWVPPAALADADSVTGTPTEAALAEDEDAQVAAATSLGEAARLTEEAGHQYAEAQFARARELYKQAYRASPEPELLFNVAQCSRRLGDHSAAVTYYDLYLAQRPDTPHFALVQSLLEESRQAMSAEPPAAADDAPRLAVGAAPQPATPPDAGSPPMPAAAPDDEVVDPHVRRRRTLAAVGAVVAVAVGAALTATLVGRDDGGPRPSSSLGVVSWQ